MIRTALTFVVAALLGSFTGFGAEWPELLHTMPLKGEARHLSRTNCVPLVLGSFRPNTTVRALVFMPGATDELHMFKRVSVRLPAQNPSLWDALVALTNQSPLRITFRSPALLVHSSEDILEPEVYIEHLDTQAKLKLRGFQNPAAFNDRDWDHLYPILKRHLRTTLRPAKGTEGSWHFYRHSFACGELNGWEALECIALAGRTKITVQRNRVVFACDRRFREAPILKGFPKD